MAWTYQVMTSFDVEDILELEKKKLLDVFTSEVDRDIHSWNARWKREALEHYSQSGWSLVVRNDDGQLMGYFLAQALLHFDGNYQTLWVEHLQYNSLKTRDELLDVALKAAREKHFQKVIFPNLAGIKNSIRILKGEDWSPGLMHIFTTKVSHRDNAK